MEDEMVVISVALDPDTVAHYQRRARVAGRTWDEQIAYEIAVNYGWAQPDFGDREAIQRRDLMRRIRTHRIVQG